MKAIINANGTKITILSKGDENDFISITDIARYKNPESPADVIKNWMRNRSTIEFLGLWEQLNNPDFKLVEFDQFKNEAGSNAFVLSPQKWIVTTNATGIISKINYKIHTDAIKENLIPAQVSDRQQSFMYANEADLLNVALFGKIDKEWREKQ
jgi:hypothetical protein